MTQMGLNFISEKQARKALALVDRFLSELCDGQWHLALELGDRLKTNDRVIRRCADLSGGRVISGDQGYKLTRFSTNFEIDQAEARLLSQARKMTDRAREIRLSRNRYGTAA